MSALRYTDLDAEPQWLADCLALFSACPPGQKHVICGDPHRMGLATQAGFFKDTVGVLLAVEHKTLRGALAICSYSDEQITLWGPVTDAGADHEAIAGKLLQDTKTAAREGGFESVRVLVDQRNRKLQTFFLNNGLTNWKDNVIYERSLKDRKSATLPSYVHLARHQDHSEIAKLLKVAFPESAYCDGSLVDHEHNGYRHYYLQDSGNIVAAAAINVRTPLRSWLNMIAVAKSQRGKGHGSRLLAGIINLEAQTPALSIALEVLADNQAARCLYEHADFKRSWTARIMTGPV